MATLVASPLPTVPIPSQPELHQDDRQPTEAELYQDVMSQFPFLNGYSHIAFGFALDANQAHDPIIEALRAALTQLTDKIPWLGGQVIHKPGPPGDSGQYVPAAWPEGQAPNEILRVKDCAALLPTFAQLTRAGLPTKILGEGIISPCPGLPEPHGLDNPWPVMMLQASFIRGGMFLTISTHHQALDASGMWQVLRMIATLMNGRELSPVHIADAHRDRSRIVPLIPPGQPVKDYSFLRKPPGWAPRMPTTPFQWYDVKIAVTSLAALRQQVMASSVQLVSDDDVLCAWCWQRISAVRVARGFSPAQPSKYTRAMDARTAMAIPVGYLGHLVHHAVTQLPLGEVATSPLHKIAAALRRDLHAANDEWSVRSYATFLAREPDKYQLMYGGVRDLDTDVGSSSMLTLAEGAEGDDGAYFGPLLGRRGWGRRPSQAKIPGCLYFQPPENGAFIVRVCLPEADIMGLKRDSEWRRYMRFIC